MQRNILLNPGPVTTSAAVKQALVVADICHREAEFTDLLRGIRRDLLKVVNANAERFTAVLFTASGTGAVEACISSVVPHGKKLAVINNGSYGQRLVEIAQRYKIDVVEIKIDFAEMLNAAEIEKHLTAHSDIAYLAMVHHETSSGILNPLHDIGQLCRRLNIGFIVDAMSSFAGVDIDMQRDNIDFIMSSSNKCLHGMPGLSFVICNSEKLAQAKNKARSYYFDLYEQFNALEKTGQMPFTPAVQVAYALRYALDEFFSETLLGRIARYRENYACLIAGLEKLNFEIVTPKELQSGLLVTVRFPRNNTQYDFDHLHDYLFARGYTIYPKKLALDNTFRLACIGDLTSTDIENFLQELAGYMNNVNSAVTL